MICGKLPCLRAVHTPTAGDGHPKSRTRPQLPVKRAHRSHESLRKPESPRMDVRRRLSLQPFPMEGSEAAVSVDMQERLEFLREDLMHLFDDRGLDASQYDEKVDYMDPITKYDSVGGYMYNIKMLKYVFDPLFELHDIRLTGQYEITHKWTMTMVPTFNRVLPIKQLWDPVMIFTGSTKMGVNPVTGKFNKHEDHWDALENQQYLSLEGVIYMFAQLGTLVKTPSLPSPKYTVLRKRKEYEIRRYEPFSVVEADMEAPASGPASDCKSALNALAAYMAGSNKQRRKLAKTTPVFTTTSGKMRLFLSTEQGEPPLPEPASAAVRTHTLPGGLFAAHQFSGAAKADAADQALRVLRGALSRDGVNYDDGGEWDLARYNDSNSVPFTRRNEVIVPVRDFDLWAAY